MRDNQVPVHEGQTGKQGHCPQSHFNGMVQAVQWAIGQRRVVPGQAEIALAGIQKPDPVPHAPGGRVDGDADLPADEMAWPFARHVDRKQGAVEEWKLAGISRGRQTQHGGRAECGQIGQFRSGIQPILYQKVVPFTR